MKIPLALIPLLVVVLHVADTVVARSLLSDSQCPTPRLKNGRIRARGRGRIIRYSCFADYELVGNKYSTCIRGSWDTPTPICVSTRCPTIPAPKHAVVGEKYRGAILMYFCEPGYQLVGNSEIYCDGRQWNGTTPYCRDTNAVAPTSCDFEKEGLCWWEQDPKHDFDWIRHRFDTPSSHIGTGPTHDHTLGAGYDGYYLYIEASGRLVNDTARIISPLYSANLSESGCFSFWYHMYGSTIGSLNVYLKLESEQTPRLMWTKQGNQGNQWLRGLFSLPPSVNSSFQVVMEGVRGSSYVSDIAIDDLAILHGDECVFKNVTSAQPPLADGDEVEIFNAIQTCKGRCGLAETTPSPELYSNPDVCQCTMDCAETSSCCPDYAEYCVYEFTDATETIIASSIATPTATESITRQAAANRTDEATTEQSSSPLASTPLPLTSTPQRTSDRITQTTTTPSTTSTTITSIATTVAAAKFTIPTSGPRITSAETKPTSASSRETSARETPFFATSAKRKDFTSTTTEPHIVIQNARQLEPRSTLHVSGIVGIIIGLLTAVAATTTLALLILRRRRYRRPSSGSPFAEDSDVRYLTSDEQLDFNLARPTDDC